MLVWPCPPDWPTLLLLHAAWWLPEQVLQGGEAVAASDVYAFGVILWELLNPGQLPWEAVGAWKVRCCAPPC